MDIKLHFEQEEEKEGGEGEEGKKVSSESSVACSRLCCFLVSLLSTCNINAMNTVR